MSTEDPKREPQTEPEAETRFEIVRGAPTEHELAALMAVVSDAYARETSEAVAEPPHVSAWQRTQRALRGPLRRDIPWGRFSG